MGRQDHHLLSDEVGAPKTDAGWRAFVLPVALVPERSSTASATPARALRYQRATAERDEAIADGIDRLPEASQRDRDKDTNVIRFRRAAEG